MMNPVSPHRITTAERLAEIAEILARGLVRLHARQSRELSRDDGDSCLVSIGLAENGLEVEIVGEIAKMVELGIENKAKRAALDETMTRSVKVVAGARNRLDLQLRVLLKTTIVWEQTTRVSERPLLGNKLPWP